MESIGYEYRSGSFDDEPDHFFLRRICGGRRTHHVHLLMDTKRDLAARYAEDRGAYIEAKSQVVEQLMRLARR